MIQAGTFAFISDVLCWVASVFFCVGLLYFCPAFLHRFVQCTVTVVDKYWLYGHKT